MVESQINRIHPPYKPMSSEELVLSADEKPRLDQHLRGLFTKLVFAKVNSIFVPKDLERTYRHFSPSHYAYGETLTKDQFFELSSREKACVYEEAPFYFGFATVKAVCGDRDDPRMEQSVYFNIKGNDELILSQFHLDAHGDKEGFSFGRFQNSASYEKSIPKKHSLICGFVEKGRGPEKEDKEKYNFVRWFSTSNEFFEFWKGVVLPNEGGDEGFIFSPRPVSAPWSYTSRRARVARLETIAEQPVVQNTYRIIWHLIQGTLPPSQNSNPLVIWLRKHFSV